eukprot:5357685-Amphidinium_carterae.1
MDRGKTSACRTEQRAIIHVNLGRKGVPWISNRKSASRKAIEHALAIDTWRYDTVTSGSMQPSCLSAH